MQYYCLYQNSILYDTYTEEGFRTNCYFCILLSTGVKNYQYITPQLDIQSNNNVFSYFFIIFVVVLYDSPYNYIIGSKQFGWTVKCNHSNFLYVSCFGGIECIRKLN